MSQGGLFELGEMAVSVRVFCAGGWKNSPFATLHGVERRAALRASAADSQGGETPASFEQLVLEDTQQERQGDRDSQRRSKYQVCNDKECFNSTRSPFPCPGR